jgi:hypothetical protein
MQLSEQHESSSMHVDPIDTHDVVSPPPKQAPPLHSPLQQLRFCVQNSSASTQVGWLAGFCWQYAAVPSRSQ